MVQWVLTDRVDLSKDAQRQQVGAPEALMLPGDNEAHRWEITVLNNGTAADLAGASVAGYFLRSDGETVMVVGSVTDGNVVTVTLAQECYAIEGLMRAIVRVTQNGAVTTLIQRLFRVQQDIGDQIIDPGEVIPDIDELLAQIAAMEAATAAANAAAAAVPDMIAPTFSASAAYAAGDYVYYDGALYRFTADHAAGAWVGTDAEAAVIGEDVSELKSAISTFQTIMTTGQYVNYTGGIKESALWSISNNFPVAKGLVVKVYTHIYGNAAIGFFDKDDNYIGGIKADSDLGLQEYTISNIPANAEYLRTSCIDNDKASVKIEVYNLYESLSDFYKKPSTNYTASPNLSDVIDGKFVQVNGTESEAPAWECTDYLDVIPGESVKMKCVCYGNGAVCLYDDNKDVVLGINGQNVSEYGGSNVYTAQIISLTIPQTARFVRMSAHKTYARVTDLYIQYDLPWNQFSFPLVTSMGKGGENTNDKYYTEKKILVLGDSISSDSYGNYKKWVTNLIDEGKFKLSNTTNSSQHATGFVARYNNLPNDFISRMESITNKGDYDLVIVFGGINDYIQGVPLGGETGQTDITTYFKPAVDYFFNYLINNFTQARICVLTPLRTSSVSPNSAGNKQEAYSDYIRSVAQSYCLPILDLTVDSGFCPFVPAFKNRWTLIPSGYTDPDGVHPIAEYEKNFLAPLIWKFLDGMLIR